VEGVAHFKGEDVRTFLGVLSHVVFDDVDARSVADAGRRERGPLFLGLRRQRRPLSGFGTATRWHPTRRLRTDGAMVLLTMSVAMAAAQTPLRQMTSGSSAVQPLGPAAAPVAGKFLRTSSAGMDTKWGWGLVWWPPNRVQRLQFLDRFLWGHLRGPAPLRRFARQPRPRGLWLNSSLYWIALNLRSKAESISLVAGAPSALTTATTSSGVRAHARRTEEARLGACSLIRIDHGKTPRPRTTKTPGAAKCRVLCWLCWFRGVFLNGPALVGPVSQAQHTHGRV